MAFGRVTKTSCLVRFCTNATVTRKILMRISAWNVIKKYIYEDFNGSYMCVLFVRVQNCECSDTKTWLLKNLNVYLSNNFQNRLSNQNFHLLSASIP